MSRDASKLNPLRNIDDEDEIQCDVTGTRAMNPKLDQKVNRTRGQKAESIYTSDALNKDATALKKTSGELALRVTTTHPSLASRHGIPSNLESAQANEKMLGCTAFDMKPNSGMSEGLGQGIDNGIHGAMSTPDTPLYDVEAHQNRFENKPTVSNSLMDCDEEPSEEYVQAAHEYSGLMSSEYQWTGTLFNPYPKDFMPRPIDVLLGDLTLTLLMGVAAVRDKKEIHIMGIMDDKEYDQNLLIISPNHIKYIRYHDMTWNLELNIWTSAQGIALSPEYVELMSTPDTKEYKLIKALREYLHKDRPVYLFE